MNLKNLKTNQSNFMSPSFKKLITICLLSLSLLSIFVALGLHKAFATNPNMTPTQSTFDGVKETKQGTTIIHDGLEYTIKPEIIDYNNKQCLEFGANILTCGGNLNPAEILETNSQVCLAKTCFNKQPQNFDQLTPDQN